MSLIQCPECSSSISDKADMCPHCGLPSSYFNIGQQTAGFVSDASTITTDYASLLKQIFPEFINDCRTIFLKDSYITSQAEKILLGKYDRFSGIISKTDLFILIENLATDLRMDIDDINKYLESLLNLKQSIIDHNDRYLDSKLEENKEYFDNILKPIDDSIMLDDEQRRAILIDESNCLIVAGAGAGKTTTMAAKVRYLVDKQNIDPADIFVISYTNKAIDELKYRINKCLNLPVKISTFHAFGFEIIKKTKPQIPQVSFQAYEIIFDFVYRKVFDNKRLLRNILLFLGYYFDIPDNMMQFSSLKEYAVYKGNLDYESIKSRLGEYIYETADKRSGKKRTITGEFLRSIQEVQIANFLYLNSIEYIYEKPYPHPIPGAKKTYTPDFLIWQDDKELYLEHYGISENYQSDIYDNKQIEKYTRAIVDKRKLHGENNTMLMETWSRYNDELPLLDHLKNELESKGFILKERDHEEVYRKLTETAHDKYVYRLVLFLIDFINNFKTLGYGAEHFAVLKGQTKNVRTLLFLDIAEGVFLYYQNSLVSKNQLDFADMINEADKILTEIEKYKEKPKYKYIIIDEFQDIAKQRFNLTKRLADVTGAHVVAVGDDWQSIFAFAGSDITLFQKFNELMGDGIPLFITHTYRNSQELIDIAGGFIQKNSSQIKKRLKSPKKINNPIIVECYDDKKDIRKNWIDKIVEVIGKIVSEYGSESAILLIGRYNFDRDMLVKSEKFAEITKERIKCEKYSKAKITFLTVHTSKGLGFDNVIVLNMIEGKYGFPSQIENDPIMKLVTHSDNTIQFAEERRLLYVAMTRTKNRVYLITPISRPSRFVIELVTDYKIPHHKDLNKEIELKKYMPCPVCGLPLKYENNKNYGLTLYMCTNEPELCDFMTNDKVLPRDIYKCPRCQDGFMIVKKRKSDDNRFYGCTNFDANPKCTSTKVIIKQLENK
jgi:DNA helicase-4